MTWLYAFGIVGMILTIWVIYLLMKELKISIKENNKGRVSDKCDLD